MVSVMELDMMLVMVLVTGRVGHGSFHGFSFGVNRGVWHIFLFPKSQTSKKIEIKSNFLCIYLLAPSGALVVIKV